MSSPETLELDPAGSTLTVWSYKAGLLSSVAHDLAIDATGWRARVTGAGELEVVVPVAGLRVRGQVKGGQVTPLRAKDHEEIEGNLRSKAVLDAARAPEARWTGRCALPQADGPVRAEGQLALAGRTRPLALEARVRREPRGARVEGEVRLRQSDWGITPFSALLGALKVQDEVKVSWSVLLVAAAP